MPPIVFRKLQEDQQPEPGELCIRPARPENRERRATALLVLQQGLDALQRGTGEASCIVVDASGTQPTFDEMLAAWLAQRLLDGQVLPAELRSIAEYARLIRQGLTPTSLPVEQTLEGIYLAIRNMPGTDLTRPEVRQAFLAGWQRLTARILQATEMGTDIFGQSLFASGGGFAEEQAYLRRDQDVYRLDVERGERWKVRLPGGAPLASGLLLREPKSLLFAFWSRRDRETPTGQAYQFLAVDWGEGAWVFSTDPVQKLSLKPLAERLQQVETTRTPAAADNPWYDGRDRQYSLAAAPRGGTKLSNAEVLRIVRTWMKPPREPARLLKMTLGSTAGIVLLAGLCLLIWKLWPENSRIMPPVVQRDHELRQVLVDNQPMPVRRGLEFEGGNAVFGTRQSMTLQRGGNNVVLQEENRFQQERPIRLRLHLRSEDPRQKMTPANLCGVRLNDKSLQLDNNVRVENGEVEAELTTALKAEQNRIEVQLCSTSDAPIKAVLEVNWTDDFQKVTLHVLAVGVSVYQSSKVGRLHFADKDAQDLIEVLKKSGNGRPYQQVIVYPTITEKGLSNEEAKGPAILKQFHALQDKAKEYDLALIFFSGHGKKFPGSDHYYFLPHNYDPDEELPATALDWDTMKKYLEGMKCRVVLIMDTCHSGAIGMKGDPKDDLDKAVARALQEFARAKRGIILLAACLGEQQAAEHPEWEHGALSLAILECLTGGAVAPKAPEEGLKDLPQRESGTGVITFADVAEYARKRVEKLVKGNNTQAVVIKTLNDIAPQQIPLATYGDKKQATASSKNSNGPGLGKK